MKKIYFVLDNPGYWSGWATTNGAFAQQKFDNLSKENEGARLVSTDILPIDRKPEQVTVVSRYHSAPWTKGLENRVLFAPIYEKTPKDGWYQTIREGDLDELECGLKYSPNFQDQFFGNGVIHVKMPLTESINTPSPQKMFLGEWEEKSNQ